MRSLLFLIFAVGAFTTNAQNLKFKVTGQKDTTVHLVKYMGKKLYYADTAEIKNGMVEFDGSKQKPGILALYIPGQNLFEFVYNKENVFVETKMPDVMGNAKAIKSEENKIFFDYVRYISSKRKNATMWKEKLADFDSESDEYKKIQEKIDKATADVEAYQENIVSNHWDKLVGRIVKMSMDIKIPEAPVDEAGNMVDSNFRFKYYREHYWDNIDLKDDRLVRTPVFHNKMETYFSKSMMVQHWDSIIYYAFDFCDQLPPKSDMFQYCVSWITSNYEKSKIMGMNKVFVHMALRYYCSTNEDGESPAHWMPKENLDKLCEKAQAHKNLVMGAVPPNLILLDTTDVEWHDLYSLESEYTLIYFWDPQCGHCKKITPKLQTLYEKKWKDRNIEIFAVGKAVGEDFENWKKYIRTNNLEFINVAVTDKLYRSALEDARRYVPRFTTIESLNYQKTYDVYATPKVWVLDKDKKIIGYSLTVSQLEDMLDKLQKKTDAEKLFPPEENVEDEQMH